MKRFCFILCFLFIFPVVGKSQLGNRYFHADTLQVSTTARTATWSDVWQFATIYADTIDVYLRVGAPDVGNWGSRNEIFLPEGLTLSIGPSPNLRKLAYRTTAGTGVIYVLGYKTVVQTYSMIWRNDYEKAIYNKFLVPPTYPIVE